MKEFFSTILFGVFVVLFLIIVIGFSQLCAEKYKLAYPDPNKDISVSEVFHTNNSDVTLEFLFEHDGVKVYRFRDGHTTVYYTDVRGKTYSKSGGKFPDIHDVETVETGWR